MANIEAELNAIMSAIRGEDVRGSIHNAIDKINKVENVQLDAGTSISAGSSVSVPANGYVNSLYIRTDTCDLLKCDGNNWNKVANLRGASISGIEIIDTEGLINTYRIHISIDGVEVDHFDFSIENGNGIDHIAGPETSGLIDTYTIYYTDGTTSTFNVHNGRGIDTITGPETRDLTDTYTIIFNDGSTSNFSVDNGNRIFQGTAVSGEKTGESFTVTGYVDHYARINDVYINTSSGDVYECVKSGFADADDGHPVADQSLWSYRFTFTAPKGDKGEKGDIGPEGPIGPQGRSINSVAMSGTGSTHNITIIYSDGAEEIIGSVRDGLDGTGSGDMVKLTYDPLDHGYVDYSAGLTDGTGSISYLEVVEIQNTYIQKPEASVTAGKVLTSNGESGATWEDIPEPVIPNDKVTHTASSANSNYEVLFSGTADNTTRTEGARKSSSLTFNPSTGNLNVTKINGVTVGSSPLFTDTKVTQTLTSSNSNYEVLFSGTADNTTRTESARKSSSLTFNPSTGNLNVTKINGVTVGSSPKFTDTNTDTKVTQTPTSGNSNYEVLFSGTADNTTRTEGARKSSSLTFNPSTGNLNVTKINGVTVGSSPKFTDTNTWRPVQNNLSSNSTSESLSAYQGQVLNNKVNTKMDKDGIVWERSSNLATGVNIESLGMATVSVTVNAKSGYTPVIGIFNGCVENRKIGSTSAIDFISSNRSCTFNLVNASNNDYTKIHIHVMVMYRKS